MGSVTLAVEGDTDLPFASALLASAKLAAGTVILRSKTKMDPELQSWNRAARYQRWLVLRDLDQDAPCAPLLLPQLLLKPEPLFCLRIVVHAVEAWAMADREALAAYLGIRVGALRVPPDSIPDPKRFLVDLARKSTKASIRKDLLPAPRGIRPIGPGFQKRLIEFGNGHWRIEVARKLSPSLDRAISAVQRLASNATLG